MIYVGDFGEVQIVPSRLMRARDALVVTPDKVEIAYLQKMHQEPLAKTGHSEKRMIVCEWTLKCLNERAHGIVADLS